LTTFHQRIVESQLLDEGAVRRYSSHLKSGQNPVTGEEFAAALVKAGALTPFQARAIYHGKGRALVLSNYLILDKIGQGGMGRIYRAIHRRMDRIVALKVLPPELADQQHVVERFHREVKAAARLHHPNIVMAFDADFAKGLHFMVMEYVEGTDLSSLVKQHGTISIERAVDYIYQAACGLHYAHLQNVIHRDVKPGNLMVDGHEKVKILDMGLVLLKDSVRNSSIIHLTKPNVVMGTVDYMSPEQAVNSSYIDERSDIYSLGISLYYLLVGKPAYGGETPVERLLAHRDAPIPSLTDARQDVDFRLESIFRKMVAKKPQDRYQSMAEVIDVLSAFTAGSQAEQYLIDHSPDQDDALNAFLLSLGSDSTVAPRTTDDRSEETIEMTAVSGETDRPQNLSGFDFPGDRELISATPPSVKTSNAPVPEFASKIPKVYVILGILAVLMIAALLYQL
ncbi:MAG TPA: serine/threonine-protein kinase, partial [Planctomycetaceae bacterium]|nr:serine/threonine-protein kinase [Planctomycetaceae bacterium]